MYKNWIDRVVNSSILANLEESWLNGRLLDDSKENCKKVGDVLKDTGKRLKDMGKTKDK